MVTHLQAHSEDLVDTAVGTQGCALETYRILCSLLGSPKVPWKILWLVTFLLAEEAKGLRHGVVDGVSSATAAHPWQAQQGSLSCLSST